MFTPFNQGFKDDALDTPTFGQWILSLEKKKRKEKKRKRYHLQIQSHANSVTCHQIVIVIIRVIE